MPDLPRFWPEALRTFSRSDFVAEYFGEEFRRVFKLCKEQELEELLCHVPAVEYDAYL